MICQEVAHNFRHGWLQWLCLTGNAAPTKAASVGEVLWPLISSQLSFSLPVLSGEQRA